MTKEFFGKEYAIYAQGSIISEVGFVKVKFDSICLAVSSIKYTFDLNKVAKYNKDEVDLICDYLDRNNITNRRIFEW